MTIRAGSALALPFYSQGAASYLPGTLTLETKNSQGNGVVVQISDPGADIPKDCLSKIYEPFYTTKKVGSGVGLGLSVVYGIVRDHKGIIKVDSVSGPGTTFGIRLPALKSGGEHAAT
jgi:two-component system, NtrC family, sensor kinase